MMNCDNVEVQAELLLTVDYNDGNPFGHVNTYFSRRSLFTAFAG
jgi:hypothetical protein